METPMEFANRWNSTFCKEGETTVEMFARMVAERDEAVREEEAHKAYECVVKAWEIANAERERQRRIDETARARFDSRMAHDHGDASRASAIKGAWDDALEWEAERERRIKGGKP